MLEVLLEKHVAHQLFQRQLHIPPSDSVHLYIIIIVIALCISISDANVSPSRDRRRGLLPVCYHIHRAI